MPTETFLNLPEDKRERLTEIALDEFANNTYSQASVSRIVDKAGIAKGSVYQYFKDKKDLYLFLIDLAGKVKLDFIQSKQVQVDWSDFYLGFASLLLLSAEFEFSGPRQAKYAKLLKNALDSEVWDESFARMKSASQAAMSGLVQRGLDQGQIRDDVPQDFVLFYINTLTTSLGEYIASKLGFDLSTLADEMEKRSHSGEAKVKTPDGPVNVLGLDFAQIVNNLIELMKNGLEPLPGRGATGGSMPRS